LRLFRIPLAALAEYLGGREIVRGIKYFAGVSMSKLYKPNGKQEIARRQRQIMLGQLYASLDGPNIRHTESGTDAAVALVSL
jgi:hypothetical protein